MEAYLCCPRDALPHRKGDTYASHGRHADHRRGRGHRCGHGREPVTDRPAGTANSDNPATKKLEGVAGKEVIMYRVETIPGGVAGRHYHPGPELAYVLEGSLIFELDGQPPVTLKAG